MYHCEWIYSQIREDDEEIEADGASYQLEMMRCLRDVNIDNNTIGWYGKLAYLLGSPLYYEHWSLYHWWFHLPVNVHQVSVNLHGFLSNCTTDWNFHELPGKFDSSVLYLMWIISFGMPVHILFSFILFNNNFYLMLFLKFRFSLSAVGWFSSVTIKGSNIFSIMYSDCSAIGRGKS